MDSTPRFAHFPRLRLMATLGSMLGLPLSPAVHGATLVNWDIPVSGATSAATSSVATGLSASSITYGPGISNLSTSSGWRAQGFNATSDLATAVGNGDYWQFNVTTLANYSVVLEQLNLGALVGTGTGGGWGTAELHLIYSSDSNFGTWSSAGALSPIGTSNTPSTASSYFNPDLTLTSGATTYFRLVGLGATGATANGNRMVLDSTNDMQFVGTAAPLNVIHDLLWAGPDGGNWNTSPGNVVWTDSGNGNAPAAFAANDNATVSSAGTINVDAGGVAAGTVAVTTASGTTTLTGGSIAAASLSKSGNGTLVLGAANTFANGVSATGGTLQIANNGALGAGTVTVNGATLKTGAAVSSVGNTLSVGTSGATLETDSNVIFSAAIGTSGAAANTPNPITKTGAGTLTLSATGTNAFGTQMNKNVTGGAIDFDITGGSVVFSGSGQRNLAGTNTWDGDVTLAGGTLMLHDADINGTGSIEVTANSTISGRLDFGGSTVANTIEIADSVTLSLNPASTATIQFDGSITGAGGLTKNGNGTARISSTASASYSGATLIADGIFYVNGTLSNTSSVAVTGDAKLGGSGIIDAPVTIAATSNLAPGTSIASLDVASVTIDGLLTIEYDGTGAGSIDRLNVTNLLDITNATVDFVQLGAILDDPVYVFAAYGSLAGTFAPAKILNLPSGYALDYNYNGLNQIALIPEPAATALGALGLVFLLRRRRN